MKRQINLADVDNSLNSLTTTYAGQFAGQYISAALLSGATIANGGITVKPNIKYKEVIKKGAWASVVKDATFFRFISLKTDGMLYHSATSTMLGRNVADVVIYLKNPVNEDILISILQEVESFWNE